MSTSRTQLLGRVAAIGAILASPAAVDATPVPAANSPAVVIRNGAMVMLFCALEGFLRDRSLECANQINQATVPYSYLPDGLKSASLISTFEGLAAVSKYMSPSDRIAEFEKVAVAASSGALGSTYRFTEYSFGRNNSNIGHEDLAKIAKSFGVENFWRSAATICPKAGIGIPGNFDEVFKGLARERHKAAHSPTHTVTHSRLSNAIPETIAIALSFDTLISSATQRLSSSQIARGTPPAIVTGNDIEFLTIRQRAEGRWAAFSPNSRRARFVEQDQATAVARALPLARREKWAVLCQDSAGRAADWSTVLG